MTVKSVRKIKTTYQAVQWNGEVWEQDEILGLMDSEGVSGYADFDASFVDPYIHLYDRKVGDQNHALPEGHWVVVSSRGKLEVLSESEYAEKYEDN